MAIDTKQFESMEYRSIGPHRGGRVVAVCGVVQDRDVYYMGTTGGGVWKSDDAGTSWHNVSDGYFKWASVGALQVAPSDPNVIYVGMGETTIRGNVSRGDGVYKSTDAGKSWQHMGLEATRNIGEIAIHPTNPDIVYVAAFGHAFGANPDRGLYRSTDGGASWERVLYVSDKAGVNEITMDPNNPRILYVSSWEAVRGPYFMSSGGEGSKLFRSFDGGDSWEDISRKKGLPDDGVYGKVGLAASGPRPGRLWALVEHEDGAVFRSDDYGETWTKGSEDRNLRQRAWYYHHIYADTTDADTAWVLNVEMWKSIDAGASFQQVSAPHGDNHDMWINPNDHDNIILGNDGGALVTLNGGKSWSSIYNQPTAEMYHVTVDNQFPYRVYGAQQDNTTMSTASRSRNVAIIFPDWKEIGGGESGYIAVDPEDSDIIYAGAMSGIMSRYDQKKELTTSIDVWPRMMMGHGAEDLKFRWNWTSPIVISPHDRSVVYSGGNHLFRTRDGGQSWEMASPDLTRADPETLHASGGPITKDNTGAETYATIFAFAESPVEAGVLWAGSDDGLVHISRDNGANWTNVNPPEMPDWALISIIEASPHTAGKAYVTATRYKSADERPYIFKTEDYGETWTEIINGIPWDPDTGSGSFTRVVREDTVREGLLFCGTENGLYASFDDGENWQSLQLNLPVTPIHDLIVKDNDLVVGTHGRSFWILDDISPLRQASEDGGAVRLFQPAPTVRYPRSRDFGPHPPRPGINYSFAGGFIQTYTFAQNEDGTVDVTFTDAGNNPTDGAVIRYWLDSEPEGVVKLDILDSDGNVMKSFDSEKADDKKEPSVSKKAGANKFVWNLRTEGPTPVEGASGPGAFGGVQAGPVVVPGNYTARFTIGDSEHSVEFEVIPDPRSSSTAEEYQAQFELHSAINAKISEVNEGVNTIRRIKSQAEAWGERSDDESIKDAAKDLNEKLLEVEGELTQYRAKSLQDMLNFPVMLDVQLAGLAGYVSTAEGQPPAQAADVLGEITEEADAALGRLQTLLDEDVAAFNAQVAESQPAAISV